MVMVLFKQSDNSRGSHGGAVGWNSGDYAVIICGVTIRGNSRRIQYVEIRMNRIHRVHGGATLKYLPPTGGKGRTYVYYVSHVPTWADAPNT